MTTIVRFYFEALRNEQKRTDLSFKPGSEAEPYTFSKQISSSQSSTSVSLAAGPIPCFAGTGAKPYGGGLISMPTLAKASTAAGRLGFISSSNRQVDLRNLTYNVTCLCKSNKDHDETCIVGNGLAPFRTPIDYCYNSYREYYSQKDSHAP